MNLVIFHGHLKFLGIIVPLSDLQIRRCIGKLFSLFLIQNICCGCSKEPSQRDGSIEHTQHMFKLMGKKIITINKIIFCYTLLSGGLYPDGLENRYNFTLIKIPYLDLCLKRGPFLWTPTLHYNGTEL